MAAHGELRVDSLSSLEGFVTRVHWVLLALILGFLVLQSALQFTPDWDTLVYHLPQALMLTGQTTFEPDDSILTILRGIPNFAHRVQGVLIFVTGGRMSAANLIGPIAIG